MNRLFVSTLILAVLASGAVATAQRPTSKSQTDIPTGDKITIGQSLESVSEVLNANKIEFGEGGFAFAKRAPDHSNLFFKLDEEHTWVCAHFSKSQQVITSISMVFMPSRQHGKASQSWVPAEEIVLHGDSSYSVRFSKPRPSE